MRSIQVIAISAVAALAAASAAHADVHVTLASGRVSIVAKDATVGEILAEWARVGQAEIANLDAVSRDRVTIELRDATEDYALAVLLRGTGGYLARRRPASASDVSLFDRLLIMPQSAVKAPAPPAAGPDAAKPDDNAPAEEPPAAAAAAGEPPSAQAGAESPARDARSRKEPVVVLADGTPIFPPNTGTGDAPDVTKAVSGDRPAAAVPPAQSVAAAVRTTQTPGRNEPPPRAMPSGLMAGRRSEAPPRDQAFVKAPPAPDTSWMDQVAPGPPAAAEIPTYDPAAQEAFRRRQATEVLDPRDFKMPAPPPPAAPPRGPGRD